VIAGSLRWYALQSVFAPRVAARALISETNVPVTSFRLAIAGAAATFLSSWLINAGLLAYVPSIYEDDHFLLEQSQFGVFFEALFFAALATTFAVATIFIWKFMFGYRAPEHGAMAAAALSLVLAVVVSPVLEVAFAYFNISPNWIQYAIYAATLFFGIGLPSFYYAEIFHIGMLRSLVLNISVLLMLLFAMLVLSAIIYLVFVAGDEGLSGLVSWLLT
jgi:hypothetical protein